MNGKGFWFKNGKIKQVEGTHINAVIKNCKAFGLTPDEIQAAYKKYKEPIGLEGRAREALMIKIIKNGWIRVRETYDSRGDCFTIQFYDFSRQKKDLQKLINYLLYDSEEIKKNTQVTFLDIDGNFSKTYSPFYGEPITTFVEGFHKKAMLVESYLEMS